MKLTQRSHGDDVILRLEGQLMGGPDAEALRSAIAGAVAQGKKTVLLDMAEVSWVNSSGLGILISSHLAARNAGSRIVLAGLTKRIESILAVTRLNTIFEVVASVDEAPRAAGSPGAQSPGR